MDAELQIDELALRAHAWPDEMDEVWAKGWRHFGPLFFRYSVREDGASLLHVQPLRVPIGGFHPSKSQRRVLRRNADLTLRVQPAAIDEERRALFARHVERFTENVPASLEEFLGDEPASVPCENIELALFAGERLVAATYLDLGREAVSSVYAMFDPAEAKRGLGICTALHEIEYARQRGCRYYYLGYAYREASRYDYKKGFRPIEWYDWKGNWKRLEQTT
jgi:arginine-tRNA-protein transferase